MKVGWRDGGIVAIGLALYFRGLRERRVRLGNSAWPGLPRIRNLESRKLRKLRQAARSLFCGELKLRSSCVGLLAGVDVRLRVPGWQYSAL